MNRKKGIHFEISERKVLLRVFDIFVVLLGLYVLGLFFDFEYLVIEKTNYLPILVLVIYLALFGTIFELYDLQKSSKIDVTFRNIVLASSTTVLFYLLTPVLTPFLPENRLQIVYFFLTIILSIFLWRVAYMTFISSPRFYKRVLLVAEVLVASYNSETIIQDIYHDLITLLEKGFTIREYTQVYEEITYRVPIQFVGKDFYKYFPFSRSNQNTLYLFFHRLFDVIFSVSGLVFGILILPLILIGNLIGNRGPLFYIQERIGKNGKPFKIVKLRSMVINAEANGAKWAQKNDLRVTAFGRFLRRSRIDEIPQFINVLKGDMSIIGPRPERPFFVNELSRVIPFYETRNIIKPGLTGWAQVNTRYGSSVDDSLTKLQYDLYYIKHRSLFLDINIIVKTLSTILYYRGQ
jgi:lipopolysaccharide/colanic/teichoic acid biosynthesis glycosyltransferase